MKVTAIKTKPIVAGDKLSSILDNAIKELAEKSVVVIASNVVSLCEGNVVKIGSAKQNSSAKQNLKDKEALVKEQAEWYLPPHNMYHIILAVKDNILIPSAGIDESNTNGYYTLWPKNPQETADSIREHLIKRFSLSHIGVIIADSKTTPLRWGVTGVALAHSGFAALNDYTGRSDIFGRLFVYEKANIADGLASSAVVVMGEGNEQTPLAVIEDAAFVQFQDRNPTKEELKMLKISMEDDVYGEILRSVKWRRGGKR